LLGRDPTRRELVRHAVSAGGLAGAAVLSPASALAGSSAAQSDAAVIGRLLGLELLVVFTYDHVLASSLISPHARQVLGPLLAQDKAHVGALTAALARLGGTPPPGPADIAQADRYLAGRRVSGRLGQLRGGRDALRLLLAIEHVAEGAYYVSMLTLGDPQLLRLGAEMMASEAQHTTLISLLLHPGVPTQAVPYALVQGRH
jgi:hypothetical protein